MSTRADILARYITATEGRPVGDPARVGELRDTVLAVDWLRYISGRQIHVPGTPTMWADAVDDDGKPTGDKLNPALEALSTVAVFYPAVVHHRAVPVPPKPGDIIVFTDAVGVHIDGGPYGWTIYTQGHLQPTPKASRIYLSGSNHQPLGWWQVRPECIHSAHGYTYEWQVTA